MSEPFASYLRGELPPDWWGTVGDARPRLSLDELVSVGMLDLRSADELRRLVALGDSLMIASSSSGVGKSTLLASLLPAVGPSRRTVIVRGRWDHRALRAGGPFAGTTFVAAEISPHLATYVWSPVLPALLDSVSMGAQLLSTIHANSIGEIQRLVGRATTELGRSPARYAGNVAILSDNERLSCGLARLREIERP